MSNLYQTGVRQIIDDFLVEESKKLRDYGKYWSASSAGYCQRKVLFEKLGLPPIEAEDTARKQRVFTAGHLFHSWIQELTSNAGCSVEQETELQDEDIMVRGHFDDIIKVEDKLILYDYKTANSRSFNYKNDLSHFHRMQLGTYLYMLRKGKYKDLSEARILILEKDTLRTKEFQLFWDAKLEKDVYSYWSTLNGYLKAQKLPKCTCADYEGGFMAKEKWNPFYYNGEPCSVEYYRKWKEEQK